jgi:hypothetical protein
MTATGAVAGAGDNPDKIVPVYIGKKKKKRDNRPEVLKRFITKQEASKKYWSK